MLQASVQAIERDAAAPAEDSGSVHLGMEATPLRQRRQPRPHDLGAPRPAILDAYSIGLGVSLDLAHGWDCKNGSSCVNRAYAGELFPSEAEARAAVKSYVLNMLSQAFPHRDPIRAYRELSALDGLEPVHILRVVGVVESCHDYRKRGCHLPDAFEQLRRGAGSGTAWSLARQNRNSYGALAARLPGRTSEGHLFAFLTACESLDVVSITTAHPPLL